MKILLMRLLVIFMFGTVLNGCDDSRHLKDLKTYVDNLKVRKPAKITHPNANVQAPIKIIPKQVVNQRSPFADNVEPTPKNVTSDPLQMYSLNTLQYKGVVVENNKPLGYVLTPANKIFSVKVGDLIGNHAGKILQIYPDRIDIEETSEDALNTKRIVSLQLKDASP